MLSPPALSAFVGAIGAALDNWYVAAQMSVAAANAQRVGRISFPPDRRGSDAGANPAIPVPHPSPNAGRRWKLRRLFSVTVGGTVPVLVAAAAAILRTTTIRRSVIAPLFESVVAIVPIALRRCCAKAADQEQSGAYKFPGHFHSSLRLLC